MLPRKDVTYMKCYIEMLPVRNTKCIIQYTLSYWSNHNVKDTRRSRGWMRNVLSLISFPGPTQRYETYCLIFVFHHIHNLIISKWKRVEAHPTHNMFISCNIHCNTPSFDFTATTFCNTSLLILLIWLFDIVTPQFWFYCDFVTS